MEATEKESSIVLVFLHSQTWVTGVRWAPRLVPQILGQQTKKKKSTKVRRIIKLKHRTRGVFEDNCQGIRTVFTRQVSLWSVRFGCSVSSSPLEKPNKASVWNYIFFVVLKYFTEEQKEKKMKHHGGHKLFSPWQFLNLLSGCCWGCWFLKRTSSISSH